MVVHLKVIIHKGSLGEFAQLELDDQTNGDKVSKQ